MDWERITPSKRGNWINQVENEWEDLLPVADKKTKAAKVRTQERAIFKLWSAGLSTNRDAWVVDEDRKTLLRRIETYAAHFNSGPRRAAEKIKWTATTKRRSHAGEKESARPKNISRTQYRPFVRRWNYVTANTVDRPGAYFETYSTGGQNFAIAPLFGERQPFCAFSSPCVPNLNLYSADGTKYYPRYRFAARGEKIDNITDWALNKFIKHFGKRAGVTKDAIFTYVYACLHDPVWRETYAINLRREFPRIPFHDDFAQWTEWGRQLMDLHIGYEDAEPWPIERIDVPDEKSRAAGVKLPVKLKAHPDEGRIEIDSETTLSNFPPRAWAYKLGNRSGLDWVLDQYKEKNVNDATVEAWLNDNPDCRYRFADHKERVIDLLARVAWVSVETLTIIELMRGVPRSKSSDRSPVRKDLKPDF